MATVRAFAARRWKALAALVAGGAATEAVTVLWPGNQVAAAVAALLTAIAVHQAPANQPPNPQQAAEAHQ